MEDDITSLPLYQASLATKRRKRILRICFHLANIILPAVCIFFVIVFFTTGFVSSTVNTSD